MEAFYFVSVKVWSISGFIYGIYVDMKQVISMLEFAICVL
jgi:hypothetical protein